MSKRFWDEWPICAGLMQLSWDITEKGAEEMKFLYPITPVAVALSQIVLRILVRFGHKGIYPCDSCRKLFPFRATILISGILPYGYDDRIYCKACGHEEAKRRESLDEETAFQDALDRIKGK